MCGIAGFFNKTNAQSFDHALLQRMGDAVTHRGPDGQGVYARPEAGVGLAHRRLSIIDLSGGGQPMANDDESVWIVFNGEIYNFQELRERLSGKGYRFKSRSDTEVIIRMYEEYGVEGFRELNGIFAFAIYDLKKNKVVLARDPFGVKPLYFHAGRERVCFGSEIKSIFCDPSVERALHLDALDEFLTFRYNPSPSTLLKGIQKLAPGHFLEITPAGCGMPKAYVSEKPPARSTLDEGAAIEEYRRLLRAAVKRQMISDVPVGLFLSGGVDSAVIGKLMMEEGGRQIKTYTIGFPGQGDFNELDTARETAKLIGSDHQELILGMKEYMEFFARSFEVVEEPVAETTISALYYVAQRAAKDLKVVLAGQGADEPMGGYHRYLGVSFIDQYGSLLPLLAPLTGFLPRNDRLKHAAYVVRQKNFEQKLMAVYSVFRRHHREQLWNDAHRGFLRDEPPVRLKELAANARGLSGLLPQTMFIDTRMSLSDDLLLFNDKVTMANSLEMRVPFLDTELVAFLESLPANLKIRGTTRKYIHKKAAETLLPAEIIHRKKRGFQTPMDQWLQSDLAPKVKRLVSEKGSACGRYFRLEYIENLIDAHQSRREDHQKRLYALFSFELWHRAWIDQKPVSPEAILGNAQ